MIKEIITDQEFLSQRSEEINIRKEGDLFRSTVLNLKDTLKENNLQFLSAVQIGVPSRVFTIQFNTTRKVFCNPIIYNCEQFTLIREKSPVLPGREFISPRYSLIDVNYQDPVGKIHNERLFGAAAYAFEQMVDSLEGVMPSDIGLEIDENFDKATDDERAEVIKMYCESINLRLKELHDEIDANPDLKDANDAIDFIESVRSGETQLGTLDDISNIKNEQDND